MARQRILIARALRLVGDRRVRLLLWATLAIEGAVAIWLSRPWVVGDNAQYLALADAISQGRYGSITALGFEPDTLRPPGYPLLLWFLMGVLRIPIEGIVIIQLITYLVSLYLVGRFLIRPAWGQSIFLALAAAYPAAMMYSSTVAAETWTILAVTSAVVLLERAPRGATSYAIVGIVAGVAAYFRSDLALVPLFIAFIILVREIRSNAGPVKATVRSAIPVLVAALLLLPYALWNYANFNRFQVTPVAGAVGTSLYLATWQGKISNEDANALYKGIVTPHAQSLGLGDEVRSINQQLGVDESYAPWGAYNYPTNRTRIAVTEVTRELALQRIQTDPWSYARHVATNGWRLWHTSNYPDRLPGFAVVALKLASWAIFILGMAGAILSIVPPRSWPLSAAPTIILLSIPAVHLWLHTEARYTASVRPILLLLAATTLVWLLQPKSRRIHF